MKNKQMKNQMITGLDRIKEIKKRISAYKPQQFATAEVYDVWENLFQTERESIEQ